VHVGALSRDDVRALAEQRLGEHLSSAAAGRLHDHTLGSPLHLHTLLDELPAEAVRAPVHLPSPRSFSTLVLGRLAMCSPAVRALVTAVAVLGESVSLDAAARLAGLSDPLEAVDEAVDNRLISVATPSRHGTGLELSMSHPLVRAAVLDDLPVGRRCELHRRAGEIVGGVAGLRHRLQAATGPDESLWHEAIRVAGAQAAAGSHGAAAALLRDASEVAASVEERDMALLDAADGLLLAGRLADACALEGPIEEMAPSPRRSYMRGRLAYIVGPRREARRHLIDAWRALLPGGEDDPDRIQLDPADQELAGRIAAMAAIVSLDRGDGPAGMTWSRRAMDLAPERAALASTAHVIAGASVLTGEVGEGMALLDAICARATASERAVRDPALADAHYGRGLLRLWVHDLAGAEADLQASLAAAVRAGSFAARESARCYLAEVRYRQGRWDEAIVDAQVSASIVEDGEQAWLRVLPHAAAARPLAGRGLPEGEAHARAALDAADAVGAGTGIALSRVSALEVAACRRDHAAVVALGDRLWDDGGGLVPERIAPWRAGYVEALVAVDRHDDAAAVCAHLVVDRSTALVASDAARAAVVAADGRGDPARAEAAAEEGLALDPDVVGPYPRALLELAVGRSRRRRGERRAAHGVLEDALARFRGLGAEPWTLRAEREIVACGLRPAGRRSRPGTDLTPQESTVAQLVARGLTNREVAAELVVSAKTIEHHLSHIYSKLGVRSRTELAGRLLTTDG
jgi:DNA-binding CsgD family transcriptional regulator